ncbi:PREDICTED: opioid growth factor receptor-like protein 1 [Nanorana parkeri]|uniref:opioid growth factor receptor-like protein 1 n=1 Tax=Nanorana parkeri TaxID=125878 RepID=UPI00085476D4|nr:PREDICTED: opioid growth factor receptor-like protein 1 [Nanorana parkeri]
MSRDLEEVWSPEYDSTWEEEEKKEADESQRGQREQGNQQQLSNCRRPSKRAARDLQNYRHGYKKDKEDRGYQCYSSQPSETLNLDFYQDKKRFEPEGLCIEQLLTDWKKKYDILERNHSYIQWLFPLREYGMNSCAKPLSEAEIEAMKEDVAVQRRFLDAYKLMLDFYGIELENEKTGKVKRAENWETRSRNLNDHSHNNLRITRILKCLGELGFEHYQAPLVKFFLRETLCNDKIQNVKRSALDYFMFTVKNKSERRKLVHFAWKNYKPGRFLWGPVEKLRTYQPPAENEHETKSCQKEKKDESDEEGKMNGQSVICKNKSDKEGFRDRSDSSSRKIMVCKQNSPKSNKKPDEELILLKNRVKFNEDSRGNFPDEDSSRCSEAVSDNEGSSSWDMNGEQLPTEGEKKSYGEESNRVSKEVSPKHDDKVPSAVGHQDEGKAEGHVMDGTVSRNQSESLQQDKMPNVQIGTPRKRKMENGLSDRKETPDRGPPQPADNSELPKEGGEGVRIVDDKVKKLKLSEQPGAERNPKVANDPLSSTAGTDPQQSGDGSDINQEEGGCSQLEMEEAKKEMPKLHEQSYKNNNEKEEDGPTVRGASGDPK